MKTLIIGDVHGKHEHLERIIKDNPADRIVQIGDLCNCVRDSIDNDLACIEIARDKIDVVLVGNHEYPHIAGNNHGFWGYFEDQYVKKHIREWYWGGYMVPAIEIAGYLVTHAGVHPSFKVRWATEINRRWEQSTSDSLFSWVGPSRGGRAPLGGVLWADFSEKKDRRYPQIVGHTHKGTAIRSRELVTCIDFEPVGFIVLED